MRSYNLFGGGHALVIAIGTLVIICLLFVSISIAQIPSEVGDIEIRGSVANATALSQAGQGVIWTSENFQGFWYDLNYNKSTESMRVISFSEERTIDKYNLMYITTTTPIQFDVSGEKNRTVEYGLDPFGNVVSTGGKFYAAVGWMGQKYVGINSKPNKLAKLVYEQDTEDKRTLTVGETWEMGGGYTLKAKEIDPRSNPRLVLFVLSKDGTKLDEKVIEAASSTGTGTQGVYTYNATFGGELNVPIFVTYVESVFSGATSDMVQLKYTWLIDNTITEVKSGDMFGIFKVYTESPILILKSDSAISLSKDSMITLADNLKFKVSDSTDNDVRFYPMFLKNASNLWEVRGSVANGATGASYLWNSENFPGFWYDFRYNKYTEMLNIVNMGGSRMINREGLLYITTKVPVLFELAEQKNRMVEYGLDITGSNPIISGGKYYAVVGWFGEKYVGINGKTNKLAKIVMEQAPTDTINLAAGEKWDMGDGYTLTVVSINAISRMVQFELKKSGNMIDSSLIEAARADGTGTQGVYTYYSNIGDESNVPIFVTYLDNISTGPDTVSLKYTWLIDTNIMQIKAGDRFGIFKVDTENPLLTLKSDSPVYLSKGTDVNLIGKLKFRIADSPDFDARFYPFMIKTMDVSLPLVDIINPTNNSTFLQGEMVAFSSSVIGDPVSYAWTSNLDGSLGNESKLLYSSLSPGTHVITLTVKNFNNIVNSTSIMIKVLPSVFANISGEQASGPMNWNILNFPGFWYNLETDQSTEWLNVVDMKDSRTIDKGKLWYYTTLAPLKFKVSSDKNRNVEYALDATGKIISTGDQYYGVAGWLGNKYVGINGKSNKLSRLILEQPVTDKKILKIGETWNMGGGYTLTVISIDARAYPRQARLVLSRDGAKLDDKVIEASTSEGVGTQGVYTFYTDIAGETNVPLFVTFIDQILPETYPPDRVQLKYTWLISDNILEIHAGDKIGLMNVDMEAPVIAMMNNEPISLVQDSTVNLLGGLHLKVTDDSDLIYYPEMTSFTEINSFPINISVSPSAATLSVGEAHTFNATVLNGSTPVSNVNISWTVSNGSVGSVTPLFSTTGTDGNATVTFTASGAGITSVIASNGSVSGIADVVVNPASSIGAPKITRFFPTTSTVTNNVSESRTFSITTNQTVNISWLINGTEVFNQTGVTTSSYTNSSAALGTWNVTVVAANNNGIDRLTWIWNVTPFPIDGSSISGFKINDTNGNGKWNTGEKGISNWGIRLIGITGKGKNAKVIRKETFTDSSGFYKFDNLPAGRYFVIEILKKGFVPTSPPVKRIRLAQGENSMNNNFTNKPVKSTDRMNDQRYIDDYESINRNIDKYKEDMNWD